MIQRGLSSIGWARLLRRPPRQLPFLQEADDDSSLDRLKPALQLTQSPPTSAATVSRQTFFIGFG